MQTQPAGLLGDSICWRPVLASPTATEFSTPMAPITLGDRMPTKSWLKVSRHDLHCQLWKQPDPGSNRDGCCVIAKQQGQPVFHKPEALHLHTHCEEPMHLQPGTPPAQTGSPSVHMCL